MPESDLLAAEKAVPAELLQGRSCIIFERHVQPHLYDQILHDLRPASQPGCSLHHVMTAEDALQMVFRGLGVAILTQAGAWRIQRSGITMRPLIAGDLRVRIQLVARSDNRSNIVSDVVRSLVKSLAGPAKTTQFKLRLSD